MPKCSFCDKTYEISRGQIIVDSATGTIKHYCSSKCRKNAQMKRKKRKWARAKKE